MTRMLGLFALLLGATLLAAGCTDDAGEAPSAPEPGPAVDYQQVAVLAPIEEVEIIIAESFPPQYFVRVVSALPNGCIQFDRAELTRDGRTLRIAVWNLEPAPFVLVACTMVYGYTEHTVALGTDFEPGERYTVIVNDVTETFMAQ